MRNPILLAAIAATLLVAAPTTSQRTTVVTGGGGALQAAVGAAQPGDTLLVRAADYDETVVDKGVALFCDPGVRIGSGQDAGLTITALPAHQAFVMHGGQVRFSTQIFGVPGSVQISNCQGPIVFDRVGFEVGTSWSEERLPRIQIDSCAQVSFTDCGAFPAVRVADSTLSVTGAGIGPITNPIGRSSFEITRSRVSIHQCGFTGGQGSISFFFASPAIHLYSGELTITRSTISGGTWGGQVHAEAISSEGGTLRHDAATRFLSQAAAPITGPVAVSLAPIPSLTAGGVPAGAPITVATHAEPGSFTVAFVSDLVAPWNLAGFGDLWVRPDSPFLYAAVVPATGTLSATAIVPPTLADAALALQPVSLTAAGALVVGAPERVVLR